MTKLLTRFDKWLDAAKVTWVQMDDRLPGSRANGGKKTFDPVGKGVRLLGDGAPGALAGKRQNGVMNTLAKRAAIDLRQAAKFRGRGFKSLDGALKLRRRLGTAGGATFLKPLCMAFFKPALAAFFEPGFTPGFEINLGIALRRRLFLSRLISNLGRRCLTSIIRSRLLSPASGRTVTIPGNRTGLRGLR